MVHPRTMPTASTNPIPRSGNDVPPNAPSRGQDARGLKGDCPSGKRNIFSGGLLDINLINTQVILPSVHFVAGSSRYAADQLFGAGLRSRADRSPPGAAAGIEVCCRRKEWTRKRPPRRNGRRGPRSTISPPSTTRMGVGVHDGVAEMRAMDDGGAVFRHRCRGFCTCFSYFPSFQRSGVSLIQQDNRAFLTSARAPRCADAAGRIVECR